MNLVHSEYVAVEILITDNGILKSIYGIYGMINLWDDKAVVEYIYIDLNSPETDISHIRIQ